MELCLGQLHKGQCGTKPPKALEQYDAKNKRQIQMQKSKYKYKIQNRNCIKALIAPRCFRHLNSMTKNAEKEFAH